MDRTQLLRLLPHQGPALWLDALLDHDAARIRGLSNWSHLDKLSEQASPCLLFEAAAQLCAAHGALYGDGKSIRGATIAKLSALHLHASPTARRGPLDLQADLDSQGAGGALYRFAIHHAGAPLLDGRLLLVLDHA